MASRKCKAKRKALRRSYCPGAPVGGIGGVAPDGGNGGHSGTTKYAGGMFNNPHSAPRPEKQGLSGHVSSYYSVINGKSFSSIISGVQYTSYQLEKLKRNARKLLHQRESRVQQGQRLRSMYLSAELPGR